MKEKNLMKYNIYNYILDNHSHVYDEWIQYQMDNKDINIFKYSIMNFIADHHPEVFVGWSEYANS